jgi:hypothetical protein
MGDHTALCQVALGFGQSLFLVCGEGLVVERGVFQGPEAGGGPFGLKELKEPKGHVKLAIG